MRETGAGAGAGDVAGGEGEGPAGGAGDAAAVLERRYRRLLMLLPRAYRADRGEEMLAVLMDGAPQRRRWPKVGEVVSLAAHGLAVRSGLSARGGASAAARPLVRAVALSGSLYFSFLSGLTLVVGVRWGWGIYVSDINHSDLDGHHHLLAEVVLGQVAGLLWLAAYVALLLGRRLPVRVLGLVLLVLTATQITGEYTALAAVPALIVVGALIVTGGRMVEPQARAGWWFAALGVVAVGVGCLEVAGYGMRLRPAAFGPQVAVAAAIVVVGLLRAWRRPEWVLAAGVVGGMAAVQRALDADHYPDWSGGFDSRLRLILIGEAVLIVVAAYAVVRQRRSTVAAGGSGRAKGPKGTGAAEASEDTGEAGGGMGAGR